MFEVVLATPKKEAEVKPKKERATPSWEAKGIKVLRYMRHPTCPFCGLEDLGKDAPIRPDRNHMIHCQKRTLDPYPERKVPVLDAEGKETGEMQTKGRHGAFLGERIIRQLTFPVRVVWPKVMTDENGEPVPEMDEDGQPTGETEKKWFCSYQWKQEDVHDWVWNGHKWVEWYNWNAEPEGGQARTPSPYQWQMPGGWVISSSQ